jgi:hypothetical protein
MPGVNPIVGGRHITSYSNVSGGPMEASTPGPSGGSPGGSSKSYNVPMAAVVGFCLLILLLFRVWGFSALGSVKVTA